MKQLVSLLLILGLLIGCGTSSTPQPNTDTTAPAVPVWTLLTPGDAQVKLKWQANTEEDLDHYRLYWRTESGVLNEEKALDKGTTAFVADGLNNGIAYFFALTAVDKNGNTSAMSTEMMAMPEALVEPPPPDEPEEENFSLSTLESINIQKGQAKALPFAIARNNFETEISFRLKNAPAGVSANLPQSTDEDKLIVTLTVDNAEALTAGKHELEFEAAAKGLTKTISLILTVEEAPETPEPPPVEGDFSVGVKTESDPVTVEGNTATLNFIFERNNFPDTINLSLKSAPDPISANLPAAIDDDGFKVDLSISDELAAGVYELEFEATAAGLSKTVMVNIKVVAKTVPEAPKPDVQVLGIIDNRSSRQLRQGHGNFGIAIEGDHFATITSAHLEKDGAVAIATLSNEPIELSIENHTDKEMTLVGNLPSGQAPGFYRLVFTTTKRVSVNESIIVTPIVAGPSGDDAAGRGTPDDPFRSLGKAVDVAGATDIIELEDGSYNIANGEQFPINVDGKSIVGESRDGTILNGFGSTADCLISFHNGVDLQNLTIRECGEEGIQLSNGTSKLTNVHVTQNATHGMLVANSAEVTMMRTRLSSNQGSGIRATDNAKLAFEGDEGSVSYLNGQSGIHLLDNVQLEGTRLAAAENLYGLRVNGVNASVNLSHSEFVENTAHGIAIEHSNQVNLASVGLSHNTIHGLFIVGDTQLNFNESVSSDNGGKGVFVDVNGGEVVTLQVTSSVVSNNGGRGIEFDSEDKTSTLIMRDSEILKNHSNGLYIAGHAELINLGTVPDPGNNLLSDNGDTYLVDARAANSGIIAAINTDFQIGGVIYDETGVKVGPASLPPYWQILNPLNKISFGSP